MERNQKRRILCAVVIGGDVEIVGALSRVDEHLAAQVIGSGAGHVPVHRRNAKEDRHRERHVSQLHSFFILRRKLLYSTHTFPKSYKLVPADPQL
jgi:hypothetical protein